MILPRSESGFPKKIRELFQFPAEGEISYVEFQKRVHPDDRVARDRAMRQAIRTHGSYETEYRIILTDGTIRWIGGRARCLVAVIDIFMPEMSGLEVQTRLRRISPSTRVIVLTAKDDPSVRRKAMNEGASGFFIKGVESGEFLAGIKAAAESAN